MAVVVNPRHAIGYKPLILIGCLGHMSMAHTAQARAVAIFMGRERTFDKKVCLLPHPRDFDRSDSG